MRLLIIGGSDAGISAALRAREIDSDIEISMVLADRYPNFSICGLPFFLSGEIPDWSKLAHRTLPQIEAAGIDVRTGYSAKSISTSRRRVTLLRDGRHSEIEYDRLIIATGASPVIPPIAGAHEDGVHVLHTMDDSFSLDDRLRSAKHVTIVGGGYIGVEMADALTHRGLKVCLMERLPNILATVDAELGASVRELLEEKGVDVVTDVAVEAIERRQDGLLVSGTPLSRVSDAVLIVVGVKPNTDLAASAGIELGERGAIRVNRQMETNVPDIYAAGDCAETWHRLLNRKVYMPLGTTSHKQGRVAGANAAGSTATFQGVVGTQAVKIFDRVVAGTGLTFERAKQEGHDARVTDVTFPDHKAYYPGSSDLRVRIIGDNTSGLLLGAQLMGRWGSEVSKRVDALATAMFSELRVADISDLDLSYTPPLSSPWDPIQMAAQAWVREGELIRAALAAV